MNDRREVRKRRTHFTWKIRCQFRKIQNHCIILLHDSFASIFVNMIPVVDSTLKRGSGRTKWKKKQLCYPVIFPVFVYLPGDRRHLHFVYVLLFYLLKKSKIEKKNVWFYYCLIQIKRIAEHINKRGAKVGKRYCGQGQCGAVCGTNKPTTLSHKYFMVSFSCIWTIN